MYNRVIFHDEISNVAVQKVFPGAITERIRLKLGLERWWRKKGNFSKRGEWHEQSIEVGKNLMNSKIRQIVSWVERLRVWLRR